MKFKVTDRDWIHLYDVTFDTLEQFIEYVRTHDHAVIVATGQYAGEDYQGTIRVNVARGIVNDTTR